MKINCTKISLMMVVGFFCSCSDRSGFSGIAAPKMRRATSPGSLEAVQGENRDRGNSSVEDAGAPDVAQSASTIFSQRDNVASSAGTPESGGEVANGSANIGSNENSGTATTSLPSTHNNQESTVSPASTPATEKPTIFSWVKVASEKVLFGFGVCSGFKTRNWTCDESKVGKKFHLYPETGSGWGAVTDYGTGETVVLSNGDAQAAVTGRGYCGNDYTQEGISQATYECKKITE